MEHIIIEKIDARNAALLLRVVQIAENDRAQTLLARRKHIRSGSDGAGVTPWKTRGNPVEISG